MMAILEDGLCGMKPTIASRRHECRGSRRGVVSSPLRGLASDDLLVREDPARGAGEPAWAIEHVIDACPSASGHLESRQPQPAQRA